MSRATRPTLAGRRTLTNEIFVPLFVTPRSPMGSPAELGGLRISTPLAPSPRRGTFGFSDPTTPTSATGSIPGSSSLASPQDSPRRHPGHLPTASMSTTTGMQLGQHARRRSSNAIGLAVVVDDADAAPSYLPVRTTFGPTSNLPSKAKISLSPNSFAWRRPAQARSPLQSPLIRLAALLALLFSLLTFVGPSVWASLSPHFNLPDATSSGTQAMLSRLGYFRTAFVPKDEQPAMPRRTHPRVALGGEEGWAEYLTTRLGSHYSRPSAEVPSQLWLTVGLNDPLRDFVQGIDHAARRSNERQGAVKSKLELRSKVVQLCLDEKCLDACTEREDELDLVGEGEVYCYGWGTDFKEEEGGDWLDRVKIKASLIALEAGRRLAWVNENGTFFKENPLPLLGDFSSYDLQTSATTASSLFDAPFVHLAPSPPIRLLLRTALQHAPGAYPTNLLLSVDKYSGRSGSYKATFDGGADVLVLPEAKFSDWTIGTAQETFESAYFNCPCCTPDEGYFLAASMGYMKSNLVSPEDVPDLLVMPQQMAGTEEQLESAFQIAASWAIETAGRLIVPPREVQFASGPAEGWRPSFEAWALAEREQILPSNYLEAVIEDLKTHFTRDRTAQKLVEELAAAESAPSVSIRAIREDTALNSAKVVRLAWPLPDDDEFFLSEWAQGSEDKSVVRACRQVDELELFGLQKGECIPLCEKKEPARRGTFRSAVKANAREAAPASKEELRGGAARKRPAVFEERPVAAEGRMRAKAKPERIVDEDEDY